ncbi:carbohydrate ABC transporter permease [Natrialba asiatica]|uniref:ABC transporter integral membrane subunit n=1 Tax=Natrialba asiatica (strain ATCC 700177 / DSM 12278 / JCM 9576 / FERM P-10747 / NBRC 102637 / 172P1) TaxID=29540 RepID=M0B647_NATA1|nr:carbohydrate ABC transporter permease [Natrialba asiatica]ELZ05982.1 ABC transporter integral membrane subunit [Natrialba asiatica DSM 12278]
MGASPDETAVEPEAETETETNNVLERTAQRAIQDPDTVYRWLTYVGIGFFVTASLFPFYWLFVLALTPNESIAGMGVVPKGFNPGAFLEVFEVVPFHRYMLNSIAIAAFSTVIVLTVGSIAGYVFGRYEFRGRLPLLFLILVISYFPPVAFLIPLFRLFTGEVALFGISSPQLYNTPWSIVMPLSAITMPLIIFLLTTFYRQIPDGLEDAARVEGSTRIGALRRIIVPLSAPGVATAGILTFIIVYNEFFFSYLMVNGTADNWSPVLHGIFAFQGTQQVAYNLMAAASIIGVIPMAVLVMIAQERIVSGLTQGALKE